MTLAAVVSTPIPASAVAGIKNSLIAVVNVRLFKYPNLPLAIRVPAVPDPMARHRIVASHNQDVLTNDAIGVITCEVRIATPLASAPVPHNNVKVCVPGVAAVDHLPNIRIRTA